MEAPRSIGTFNSRLWNKNDYQAWIMYLGDISYLFGTQYNNSVVDTVDSPDLCDTCENDLFQKYLLKVTRFEVQSLLIYFISSLTSLFLCQQFYLVNIWKNSVYHRIIILCSK